MRNDLIHGRIGRSLILFTVPLIMGNLLQQFYNIADSFIVGRFISTHALGAVGSSFAFMVFLSSIVIGLCLGSGVLFSLLYGGKKNNELRNSIFISFVCIGVLTCILEFLCLVFIEEILLFLNIPNDIYNDTYSYLYIILLGLVFTFIYNFFTCLLRALGNSKVPLVFLTISTVINIVLDYVFIVYFNAGIKGAALATIIAQCISGIGIMFYYIYKYNNMIPKREDMYFNKTIFYKIRDYSIMTCLQQSIMNFGILMIQGLVNSYGSDIMSAFSICVKIDAFAYMPVQDFGNAFSTFIALNIGANRKDRVNKGIKLSFMLSGIFGLVISLFVFMFARELIMIFIDIKDCHIIEYGITYLHTEGLFYILIGWLFLLYGYYRAIGKAYMSLILTIISLGTRVLLAYTLSPYFGVHIIWWSIVIGWFLADLCGILYYMLKGSKN